MISIAVVDDDARFLREFSQKIKEYFQKKAHPISLHLFHSSEEFLHSGLPFDILFLDIQMKGSSGMNMAAELRRAGNQGYIVFITILKEYIFDSFSVEASDYLIKPIAQDRLEQTLNRLYNRLQKEDQKILQISSRKQTYLCLKQKEIYYCEALNHKIEIHLKDSQYDCLMKLEELQKKLDRRFFRCHRSYLVNLDCLQSFQNDMAVLNNQVKIPVSRLRRKEFSQAIFTMMKEKKENE